MKTDSLVHLSITGHTVTGEQTQRSVFLHGIPAMRRFSGIPPRFTLMNGPTFLGGELWMASAMSSFPVPVSPLKSTGLQRGATCSTIFLSLPRPKSAHTISSSETERSSSNRYYFIWVEARAGLG